MPDTPDTPDTPDQLLGFPSTIPRPLPVQPPRNESQREFPPLFLSLSNSSVSSENYENYETSEHLSIELTIAARVFATFFQVRCG